MLTENMKRRKMAGNKEHIKFRNTKLWKKFRGEVIKERAFTCELCGTVKKKGMHLHHLHVHAYSQLRKDWFKVICPSCHRHIIERFAIKKSWGKYADIWHKLLDEFMPFKENEETEIYERLED